MIKEVRALTGLGLKEAKALVDDAPSPVLEGASKEEAEAARDKIAAVGGLVEVRLNLPISAPARPERPGPI